MVLQTEDEGDDARPTRTSSSGSSASSSRGSGRRTSAAEPTGRPRAVAIPSHRRRTGRPHGRNYAAVSAGGERDGGGQRPPRRGIAARRSAAIVGITYRQLDYWARTDLLPPVDHRGPGERHAAPLLLRRPPPAQGHQAPARRRDLAADRLAGPSHACAPAATRWPSANLVIDEGRTVLAHSGEEIIDLLKGGQGVLNIVPLAGVVSELEAAAIHDAAVPSSAAAPRPRRRRPRRRRATGTGGSAEARCCPVPSQWRLTAGPTTDRRRQRLERRSGPGRGRAPLAAPADRRRRVRPRVRAPVRRAARLLRRGLAVRADRVRPRVGRGGQARSRAFRPDFYLPAYDLYIEITTLNQRLVTKKNRKVRRLRRASP